MKRAFLIIALCVCAFQLSAQNRVEFLGLQISGNTKSTFAEKLTEKGYKYKNGLDGYVMYSGQFVGADATVMLVPSDSIGDGITAVTVGIDEINPVKMGQLFAELLQKYMQKYSDYKYTTTVRPTGGTQVLFRKRMPNGLFDFISIESKVSGSSCALTINYAADIKIDTTASDGDGIGINDI